MSFNYHGVNMPDFFSYFSPKKIESSQATNVEILEDDVASETFAKPNLIIDEGDVDGILNENFDNCCGRAVDLSSVESLSLALLKLESEKECLESEIQEQYDKISVEQFSNLVNRILTVTQVETQEDTEEINDMFDLLKSTASFVERRLRKLKVREVPSEGSSAEISQDTETLGSSEEHQVCVTYSEEEQALADSTVEQSCAPESVQIDDGLDDNEGHSNSVVNSNESSEVVNESNNVSDVEDDSKQENIQDIKARFGSNRTRWSIRKVFKKNF